MGDEHAGKGVIHLSPGEGRRYALGRIVDRVDPLGLELGLGTRFTSLVHLDG